MSWHPHNSRSSILYAIVLFLLFDSVALGLNFWLTQRVQNQTLELNLAGRQRMLSQKMVKELLLAPPGAASAARLENLAQTAHLFDLTLIAFRSGGSTLDTSNQPVTLPSMASRPYYYLIQESWAIWQPIRERLFAYTANPQPKLFLQLNETLVKKNLALLSYMNSIALAIEQQAQHETRQIRILQAAALLLGIINFGVIFLLYRSRLKLLENEQSLINTLLNNMTVGVAFCDEYDQLLHANPRFIELLGISIEEAQHCKITELIIPHPIHDGLFTLSHKAFNRAVLKVERSSAQEQGQHLSIWQVEDVSDAYSVPSV
ncbi:type IV pili methyl-accepting chemotaxis transducer N-terminal domain-containing protein [Marinomonas ostreistagni]|uniref:type IV pili methyl-accepting chemotaxis transducer N-terminal domain-containing protein n=1 Tax=Marinomonas ostreistagni TaxID=359209 RepID=UPI00194EE09D|nr:type IV pili methyl-accepting chemotaxis transducer N-terminal domain-containing protein [Marinomonas ostreistagni]MBM6551792.1 type IV pili methyl-accepting chemotaxis transducer N-terminal domain-containing protein [Marinomonas ostreistagni]